MRQFPHAILALAIAGAGLGAGQTVWADETSAREIAESMIEVDLRPMLQIAIVTDAVLAQNAAYPEPPKPEEIVDLDAQWLAEKAAPGDLTRSVDDSEASAFLRNLKSISAGTITEILVMDRHGRLVAQSDPATDYFQGDEAKFLETFPKGAEAVFVDEVQFDESVNAVQGQASFTLTDPATDTPIGAVTVGISRGWLYREERF